MKRCPLQRELSPSGLVLSCMAHFTAALWSLTLGHLARPTGKWGKKRFLGAGVTKQPGETLPRTLVFIGREMRAGINEFLEYLGLAMQRRGNLAGPGRGATQTHSPVCLLLPSLQCSAELECSSLFSAYLLQLFCFLISGNANSKGEAVREDAVRRESEFGYAWGKRSWPLFF